MRLGVKSASAVISTTSPWRERACDQQGGRTLHVIHDMYTYSVSLVYQIYIALRSLKLDSVDSDDEFHAPIFGYNPDATVLEAPLIRLLILALYKLFLVS